MKEIAACLGVNRRTLQRWQKLGPLHQPAPPAKERPARRKLDGPASQALQTYFDDNLTSTLQQASSWLRETLNVVITRQSVGRYCR